MPNKESAFSRLLFLLLIWFARESYFFSFLRLVSDLERDGSKKLAAAAVVQQLAENSGAASQLSRTSTKIYVTRQDVTDCVTKKFTFFSSIFFGRRIGFFRRIVETS